MLVTILAILGGAFIVFFALVGIITVIGGLMAKTRAKTKVERKLDLLFLTLLYLANHLLDEEEMKALEAEMIELNAEHNPVRGELTAAEIRAAKMSVS